MSDFKKYDATQRGVDHGSRTQTSEVSVESGFNVELFEQLQMWLLAHKDTPDFLQKGNYGMGERPQYKDGDEYSLQQLYAELDLSKVKKIDMWKDKPGDWAWLVEAINERRLGLK